MKLIIIPLLFCSFFVLSQQDTVFIKYNTNWDSDSTSYTQDTIVFEARSLRNYLVGTTVFPRGSKFIALGYGLDLVKVTKSDCQGNSEMLNSSVDRINSINKTDTSLIVDVNIHANCCYDFLCEPEIINENTLNLKYTGYGTFCACNCCFGLVYHFDIWNDSEDLKKIKFITVGNEPTSIQDFPE